MESKTLHIQQPSYYEGFRVEEEYNTIGIGNYAIENDAFRSVKKPSLQKLQDFHQLKFPLNLNIGFDSSESPPIYKGAEITYLLQWIVENKFRLTGTNIVVSRGVMRIIGGTLFDVYKEKWLFVAHKYKGIVYINRKRTARWTDSESEYAKRCCYWGLKFEDLITTKAEEGRRSYYNVVKAKVLNINVVTRGEIDCSYKGNYVEIKTCLEPKVYHSSHKRFYQDKLCKTWLQSYLSNVKHILYGFRDKKGYIRDPENLQCFDVAEVPSLCKEYWSASAIMSFIHVLFEWMIAAINEDCTVSIAYEGDGSVSMQESDEVVLPDWYTSYVMENLPQGLPIVTQHSGPSFHIKENRSQTSTEPSKCDLDIKEVGCYRIDDEDTFHLVQKDSCGNLKGRGDLQFPLNLNEGFNEERIDKPFVCEKLSYMIKWIVETQYSLKGLDIIINTQTVMAAIGMTLADYYQNHKWYLECFKFRGKVYIVMDTPPEGDLSDYLRQRVTGEKGEKILDPGPADVKLKGEKDVQTCIDRKKPLYYGIRFEDVLTTNNEGYYHSVITSQIAGYNVLTRAEIDCSNCDKYIELKVGLNPKSKYDNFKFRKVKLSSVWLQCYYGGIDRVVYGLRNYQGIVDKLQTYDVPKIPAICQKEWNANEMKSFVDDVLKWVIGHTKEGHLTVARYRGAQRDNTIELAEREVAVEFAARWFEVDEDSLNDLVNNY